MKKNLPLALLLPVFILSACQKSKVENGVSWEMAEQRKENVVEATYSLHFDIPESKKDSITGQNHIYLVYKKTKNPYLFLDFNEQKDRIKKIVINKKPTNIIFENGHIVIPSDLLNEGNNEIIIDFTAGELSLNRNADYLYTLFVPDRASTCFPGFDQPDIKASYFLELNLPMGWEGVSNTKIIQIDTLENRKLYHFSLSKPISTYHFAFAAGKFQKITDASSGMTMYYRETDSVKVSNNVKKIFELHQQSIAWMEQYTAYPYPFIKFDFVLIPSFQYGGMEHPGNIFYRESSLLLESTPSVNQELRRAGLIAHETAHMWFGNLVTMKWFNDVWLKEVFANFMASKIVNPQFPQVNHDLRFLMAHYPSAYEIDRSQGSHPIQQKLGNLKNAGTLYGAIIYQKAPIMMRNLEELVGKEEFQKGIRDYMIRYNYKNATWDDLLSSIENFTNIRLGVWNKAWIKSSGMPELDYNLVDGSYNIRVTNDTAGIYWPQHFQYQFNGDSSNEVMDIVVKDEKTIKISLAESSQNVVPNFKGRGYGYFGADEDSRTFMLNTVNTNEDPEVRAGIWMNIWEYTLNRALDPKQTLQTLLTSLHREKNRLLLEYLTTRLEILFWQFITPAYRQLVAQEIDNQIFDLMAIEKDVSLRRTLYNCYVNVAMSTEGISNLKKFWNNEITLALDISEQDHIKLAYELAVRNVEDYEEILTSQLEKIKNPDRIRQMKFVMEAVSHDMTKRDAFFKSLKQADNRAHELWVLEALSYIHHPLRGPESIKYIKPSLEIIEEIQMTGDIFFPKGWLSRTLEYHNSKEAVTTVNEFLKTRSDLSPNLISKILQSADMMYRAEKILSAQPSPSM